MTMWTRAWSEGARASTAPAIPKYACSTAGMRRPHIAIQAAAFRRPIAVRRRASTTTGETATANESAPAAIQPADKNLHLPSLDGRSPVCGPAGREANRPDRDAVAGTREHTAVGSLNKRHKRHLLNARESGGVSAT